MVVAPGRWLAELTVSSPWNHAPCVSQGASRTLTLVLTPTAVKVKMDGQTQIKDGYNPSFKVILSVNRLNTFVLQLSEVCSLRCLPYDLRVLAQFCRSHGSHMHPNPQDPHHRYVYTHSPGTHHWILPERGAAESRHRLDSDACIFNKDRRG